ncbi:hypothetical protein [Aquisalimonas sp.]|uniref:hypothetical protein n=1 Tax=Aquisalimonas sp. TaxID=1872621 RepID=UPI0025B8810C|nr:hypothetical protein [Aquisalimonas sp.]
MNDEVETVLLMADTQYQTIASKLVKEIARLGGDGSGFVPPAMVEALAKEEVPRESSKRGRLSAHPGTDPALAAPARPVAPR